MNSQKKSFLLKSRANLKARMLALAIMCAVVLSGLGLPVYAEVVTGVGGTSDITLAGGEHVAGEILVGLNSTADIEKSIISAVNSSTEPTEFLGVNVSSIEDLTDTAYIMPIIADAGAANGKVHLYKGAQTLLLELSSKSDDDLLQTIETLKKNPLVSYAEPNYIVTVVTTMPNDPYYDQQYAVEAVWADEAWDVFTGSKSILVGVLDTGIDHTHVDLAANVNMDLGYDFLSESPNPVDDNGHGTYVSGVIGAVGNNAIGVAGINWHVTLVPLKFVDSSGFGTVADSIRAIVYAETVGISVLNASYRFYTNSAGHKEAIEAFSGIMIAGSGNEKNDNDLLPCYPAAYNCSNLIAVGGSTSEDEVWEDPYYGSNYGAKTVDLFAPGKNVYTTARGSAYSFVDGTSIATPHVTGTAALLLGFEPSLTPQQVKSAIMNSVDKLPAFAGKAVSNGRLNVYKAIQSVLQPASYTITYNANGGSGEPAPQIKTQGIALTLREEVPVRPGFTFLGWSTTSDAGAAEYVSGGAYTMDADKTLYAVWAANSSLYNVRLDAVHTVVCGSWANESTGNMRFWVSFHGEALNAEGLKALTVSSEHHHLWAGVLKNMHTFGAAKITGNTKTIGSSVYSEVLVPVNVFDSGISILHLTYGNVNLATAYVITPGDVGADFGSVNASDMAEIARIVNSTDGSNNPLPGLAHDFAFEMMDMTCDGLINASDVGVLARIINGIAHY